MKPGPSSHSTAADLVADSFIGSYHVLRRVGGGAMGDVFLGRSVNPTSDKALVVVKLLAVEASLDPLQTKHFMSEAYLLSQLDHRNIVRTFESGVHENRPYLAMEYIDGPDLGQLCALLKEQGLALPNLVISDIFHQLLAALEYIHGASVEGKALGLVHRDICPDNIFVARNGRVCLGDFGLTLHGDQDQAAGKILHGGHLGYMAPEQLEMKTIDQRSDVFALVGVLFKLVHGRSPFHDSDLTKSKSETLAGRFLKVPKRADDEVLNPFFKRGLAVRPSDRFQTATELRHAFNKVFGRSTTGRGTLAALARLAAVDSRAREETPVSASGHRVALNTSDAEVEREQTRLLTQAGYTVEQIAAPDLFKLDPSVPTIVDLSTVKAKYIESVNGMNLPITVALLGPLSANALEKASRLRCRVLCFAPYSGQSLLDALRTPAADDRDEAVTVAKSQVSSRRVLLVDFPEPLRAELSVALAAIGVSAEAAAAKDVPDIARVRSHHLVARATDALSSVVPDIANFRQQLGYDLVPFVIWIPGGSSWSALLSSLPKAAIYLGGKQNAATLSQNIASTLANHSQRAFVRFPVRMAIDLTYNGHVARGMIINLGRLGALLRCQQLIHVGDSVKVSCPDVSGQVMQVEGRVANVRVDGDNPGSFFIGLDFAGLAPKAEGKWMALLAMQALASS